MKKNKTQKTATILGWSVSTILFLIAILALLKKTQVGFFEV